MGQENDAVAELLFEYSDLLSILTKDSFKPRAYLKAARAIQVYPVDLSTVEPSEVFSIPGIGKSIGGKIQEYLKTGRVEDLEELRGKLPAGFRELTKVPGLGPKRAKVLFQELHIDSIDALEQACREGRLENLDGFGVKTEEKILLGIDRLRRFSDRTMLDVALKVAKTLLEDIRATDGTLRATYAGSLRRMRETVRDLDLLVASTNPTGAMETFVTHTSAMNVLSHGPTKSQILTHEGLQVDLRVVPLSSWGAALMYFTGSRPHNIRVRSEAVRRGWKLNEYGLFDANDNVIAAESEEEVLGALGLPWIPPPLRENRGEVEAALAGKLPKELVRRALIRGDLHTHTNLTDGMSSLEEMLDEATSFGYQYYAVTDHAPNLYMQRMTDEKIMTQHWEIKQLQSSYPHMTILHGSELNIATDGSVDWPDDFLDKFDIGVASIHSNFNQTKEQNTKRLVTAMENSHVNIIGHPTTRQIGKRDALEFDLDEVFKAAARTNTAMEINSHSDRLDLNDEHILWARKYGVKFAVNTDAHHTAHLDNMHFGTATAQRGWLTPEDVINTWPLERLRSFLKGG